MPGTVNFPSHFTVLQLREPTASSSVLTPAEIKTAYKRALLLHHPDKSKAVHASGYPTTTVDQITVAYQTLVSPSKQREYIHHLLAARASAHTSSLVRQPSSHSFDTVDLDDMVYDETLQHYSRPCRCGRQEAYVIKEEELEERVEDGEVLVGCEGCSLWIRIQFGVVGDG